MNTHMFQFNEDLVKTDCTLQEWQDYLNGFNDCGFSILAINPFVAQDLTVIANDSSNYHSPNK